ncbi:MAG: NADP-reducing hydrogenase subunit HndA [Phycisphaerae bacterium]|nr:NADP-reducing hydrogenase subunit HndA [Phycisphaerae bacterium]
MTTAVAAVSPPTDDKRWKMVETTMRKHGHQPNALIETLHKVQELFGFLDDDALRYVARMLRVPLSKVYGVATFYHYFTLKPQGEHTCVVCMGTACYIKGAATILEAIEDAFGIAPGQTTPDGKLSLLTARCLGSCGIAPALTIDGRMNAKGDPSAVVESLRKVIAT